MLIQTLLISICVIIALANGLAFLNRKRTSESLAQLAIACAVILQGTSFLMHRYHTLSLERLMAVNYLFGSMAATAHLFLTFHYTNRAQWINLRTLAAFLVQPLVIQVLFWSGSLNAKIPGFPLRINDLLHTTYILAVLFTSDVLWVRSLRRIPRTRARHWNLAVAIACLPFLAILGSVVGGDLYLQITAATLAYAMLLAGIAYGLFNIGLFERIFITRDAVVEEMMDGWMVVDDRNTIVDMNRTTEELIGTPREKLYGQPVTSVLQDWTNIFNSPEKVKDLEMRRSVKARNEWRYINIRVSKLIDSRDVHFGYLILWRDITKRKMADDARQHARDELFVLLSAISSAASQAMNLEEFLNESINQVIYSFRSQAAGVYLLDENKTVGGQQQLVLKTQFGILPEQIQEISDHSLTSALMQWLKEEQEKGTLSVLDLHGENLQPYAVLQELGFTHVALIPLYVTSRGISEILGCLCLARQEDLPFTQDEIIRLKTISSQVSGLIDGDRRREFAIQATERQRLMRDLHDSVSQKLYGLLALTEAAQAGMEAGSTIAPLEVLTRIGDNARQAVREMRLFLYEMQPVDLKEGLVTVLHHRLAAVEGRADIKARLLVDEDLVLPKDQEIALYFITQEALNNILRHAHAKNVLLTLRKTRQNVILQVKDDGDGFDTKHVDEGGLGLRNMQERTLNLDGKFFITSLPGKGTKITVRVPRNGKERYSP
jgi:PAS domain S-box-containing protein